MKTSRLPSKNSFTEKGAYRLLFFILFGYAVARAIMVVPMLDEISTFFSYICTGNYFNTIEKIDANNHLLNSFFGHQFYRLFGDSFFLFRIVSLVAFPIYFFSLKYIVGSTLNGRMRHLVFLSLVCIPWVFEYFSYSRGYSSALAFFFAAIAFTIQWQSSGNWKHAAAIYTCLWFSLVSNLSYLLPTFVLLIYFQLLFVLQKDFTKRSLLIYGGMLIFWTLATLPFINYSFQLQEAGALWWGNQDGLWESTGTSLSNLVLFTDSRWVLYVIVVLLSTSLLTLLYRWVKTGFWSYLKKTEAMLFILLAVVLAGIVTMRYVLDVNYPMDRVAMYLIPLFILSVSVFLSKLKWIKYSLLALIFFPISFVYHMNVTTSIFSPEDRISYDFAALIKSNLSDNAALSAEHVSHVSYAFASRNDKKVHMAHTVNPGEPHTAEYHISWLQGASVAGYSNVSEHPFSKTGFMKRDQQVQRALVVDTLITNREASDLYFTTLQRSIDSSLLHQKVQIQISAEMDFEHITRGFNFVQTIRNNKNEVVSAYSPKFNWYFSDRTDVNFVFTDQVFELHPEATHFHFFWVNTDQIKVSVKKIRVRIFKVSELDT